MAVTEAELSSKPNPARWLVVLVPYVWLLLFFLAPFLIILKISLSDTAIAMPPYTPVFDGFASFGTFLSGLDFDNYVFLTEDPLYMDAYLSSLRIAIISTILLLLIGYPMALGMARAPTTIRPTLVMLVILPFWTSFLLRVYAWKGILANHGLLNDLLIALGVVSEPLHMMNTSFSLVVGMVYAYLPFMILPLYANLVKMDMRYLEAAADLGATPLQAFWRITVPLSKSGIIAGAMLVFIPSVGEYVIPELLGGPETLMIGRVLWDEYFTNNDWAMASSVTVLVVLLILVPMAIFNKYKTDQGAEGQA